MIDVPRDDAAAPLRAVIPEWLTKPPEIEIQLRQARAEREKWDAALARAGRTRCFGAVRAALCVALPCVVAFEGFAPLPLASAVAVGATAGYALHRLDEGILAWTIAGLAMGCLLIPCIDGLLGRIFVPAMAAVMGNVAGVVRDPSFRL